MISAGIAKLEATRRQHFTWTENSVESNLEATNCIDRKRNKFEEAVTLVVGTVVGPLPTLLYP